MSNTNTVAVIIQAVFPLSSVGMVASTASLAHALVEKNAAYLVEESQIQKEPDVVKNMVLDLLAEPQRLQSLGANALKMAKTDAKDTICDLLVQLAQSAR